MEQGVEIDTTSKNLPDAADEIVSILCPGPGTQTPVKFFRLGFCKFKRALASRKTGFAATQVDGNEDQDENIEEPC